MSHPVHKQIAHAKKLMSLQAYHVAYTSVGSFVGLFKLCWTHCLHILIFSVAPQSPPPSHRRGAINHIIFFTCLSPVPLHYCEDFPVAVGFFLSKTELHPNRADPCSPCLFFQDNAPSRVALSATKKPAHSHSEFQQSAWDGAPLSTKKKIQAYSHPELQRCAWGGAPYEHI